MLCDLSCSYTCEVQQDVEPFNDHEAVTARIKQSELFRQHLLVSQCFVISHMIKSAEKYPENSVCRWQCFHCIKTHLP